MSKEEVHLCRLTDTHAKKTMFGFVADTCHPVLQALAVLFPNASQAVASAGSPAKLPASTVAARLASTSDTGAGAGAGAEMAEDEQETESDSDATMAARRRRTRRVTSVPTRALQGSSRSARGVGMWQLSSLAAAGQASPDTGSAPQSKFLALPWSQSVFQTDMMRDVQGAASPAAGRATPATAATAAGAAAVPQKQAASSAEAFDGLLAALTQEDPPSAGLPASPSPAPAQPQQRGDGNAPASSGQSGSVPEVHQHSSPLPFPTSHSCSAM